MKMSTDEIIKRINDKRDNVLPFKEQIINEKIFVFNGENNLNFQLSYEMPKGIDAPLGYFLVTKQQAAEVIAKISGRDNVEVELNSINEILYENDLPQDDPFYIVPFLGNTST